MIDQNYWEEDVIYRKKYMSACVQLQPKLILNPRGMPAFCPWIFRDYALCWDLAGPMLLPLAHCSCYFSFRIIGLFLKKIAIWVFYFHLQNNILKVATLIDLSHLILIYTKFFFVSGWEFQKKSWRVMLE
jgi:hypothetical protein